MKIEKLRCHHEINDNCLCNVDESEMRYLLCEICDNNLMSDNFNLNSDTCESCFNEYGGKIDFFETFLASI